MRLLVTGAAGLLGGNLLSTMSGSHELVGIDRNNVSIPGASIHVTDLLNSAGIEHIVESSKPSTVIHCAGATNVDWCELNPKKAYELNVQVTKKLVDICNTHDIKLVFISTDAVFDGLNSKPYDELDIVNPLNVYANTKIEAERNVMAVPRNLIIRTNIFGFNIREKYSIAEWILYSLFNDKEIKLFNDVYFSPILVNEVAPILERLISYEAIGVYNVCSSNSMTKFEFGRYIKNIFEISKGKIVEASIDDFDFKAPRPKKMNMSGEKLGKQCDIELYTVEENLDKFKILYINGYHKKLKEYNR